MTAEARLPCRECDEEGPAGHCGLLPDQVHEEMDRVPEADPSEAAEDQNQVEEEGREQEDGAEVDGGAVALGDEPCEAESDPELAGGIHAAGI